MAEARNYVRDTRELAALCARARDAGRFGLDVEFIRERSFYPKIALVQLAVDDELVLVDPLSSAVDLEPLDELIIDPAVEKVLHAAGQDMEIFYYRTGKAPRNVFDVQIAAALVGLGMQIAYGTLVSRAVGVQLAKGESFTDWLVRPLSPDQERYALDDVRYLLPAADWLRARLGDLGRESWVREECAYYEDGSTYAPDPRTLYMRVKRSGGLSPRGLAVLRELAAWREAEAKDTDRPRRSVVSDEVLVELARMAPRREEALARFRGLHPRLASRSGRAIIETIRRGLAVPDAEMPTSEARQRSDPEDALTVDFLDFCLRAFAARENIAPGFIGNRADLERLVSEHRAGTIDENALAIFHGWRRALVGNDLLAVLDGRLHVYLDPATGMPHFVSRD